jgi:hypothetical protein
MRALFYDETNSLRNGWWALIYLALLLVGILAFKATIPLFKRFGIPRGEWVTGLLFLLSLLAAWVCTRLRREPLAGIGYRLNGRWAWDLVLGTLLGGGVMLLAAGLLWAAGGVTFTLDAARSFRALGLGFGGFVLVALFEENLFRGFLFQRLVAGMGPWPAQILLALFFGISHWGNPGMQGGIKVWATLNIALAAILMGLAYLRTRSLALPIGIHLGWNWTQGNVLGFAVSGTTGQHGWLRPTLQGRPEWVSGGAFGLEASVFGVAVVLLAIFLLWTWKGRGEAMTSAGAALRG